MHLKSYDSWECRKGGHSTPVGLPAHVGVDGRELTEAAMQFRLGQRLRRLHRRDRHTGGVV